MNDAVTCQDLLGTLRVAAAASVRDATWNF